MNNYSTKNLTKRKLYFEQTSLSSGNRKYYVIDKSHILSVYVDATKERMYVRIGKITEDGILYGATDDITIGTITYAFDAIILDSENFLICFYKRSGDLRVLAYCGTINTTTMVAQFGNSDYYALQTGEEVYRSGQNAYDRYFRLTKISSTKAVLSYIKKWTSGYTYTSVESSVITISSSTPSFGTLDERASYTGADPKRFIRACKISDSSYLVATNREGGVIRISGFSVGSTSLTYRDNADISLTESSLTSIIDLGNEQNFAVCYFENNDTTSNVVIGDFSSNTVTAGATAVSKTVTADCSGSICQVKDKYFMWLYKDDSNDIYAELCFADTRDMTTRCLTETKTEITYDLPITENSTVGDIRLLQTTGTAIEPYIFLTQVDKYNTGRQTLIKLLST